MPYYKRFIFTLVLFATLSQSVFAASWECEKTNLQRYEEGINVSVTCTDGISTPISVTRPVFRPAKDSDIKNAIRNIAVEMKARQEADLKSDTVFNSLKNKVVRAKDTDANAND